MGPGHRAHRLSCRFIIEKDPAATVDLQVDEPGRKHRSRWHQFGQPVTRTLIPRRDALNYSIVDHDHGIVVPAMSIENAISRNRRPATSRVSGWFKTHFFLTLPIGAPDRSRCARRSMHARGAGIPAELRQLTSVPDGAVRFQAYSRRMCALTTVIFPEPRG